QHHHQVWIGELAGGLDFGLDELQTGQRSGTGQRAAGAAEDRLVARQEVAADHGATAGLAIRMEILKYPARRVRHRCFWGCERAVQLERALDRAARVGAER